MNNDQELGMRFFKIYERRRKADVLIVATLILAISLLYRFNVLPDWLFGLLMGMSIILFLKAMSFVIGIMRELKRQENNQLTKKEKRDAWTIYTLSYLWNKIQDYEIMLNIPDEERCVVEDFDTLVLQRKKEANEVFERAAIEKK